VRWHPKNRLTVGDIEFSTIGDTQWNVAALHGEEWPQLAIHKTPALD
jgi:hypothetical protein